MNSTLKPESLVKKSKAQQKIAEDRAAAKVTRKAVRIFFDIHSCSEMQFYYTYTTSLWQCCLLINHLSGLRACNGCEFFYSRNTNFKRTTRKGEKLFSREPLRIKRSTLLQHVTL